MLIAWRGGDPSLSVGLHWSGVLIGSLWFGFVVQRCAARVLGVLILVMVLRLICITTVVMPL